MSFSLVKVESFFGFSKVLKDKSVGRPNLAGKRKKALLIKKSAKKVHKMQRSSSITLIYGLEKNFNANVRNKIHHLNKVTKLLILPC